MILGLLGLVLYQGGATFWPAPLVRFELADGTVRLGEITRADTYRPTAAVLESLPEGARAGARRRLDEQDGEATRWLLRTGNFELTGEHFHWVSDFAAASESRPAWAMVFERQEWGRFYGIPRAFRVDGRTEAEGPEASWAAFRQHHRDARDRWRERRRLEIEDLGAVNHRLEAERLKLRQARLDLAKVKSEKDPGSDALRRTQAALAAQEAAYAAAEAEGSRAYQGIRAEIARLNAENDRYELLVATGDGQEKVLKLADVVRAYPANRLSLVDKAGIYLSRWAEFLIHDPREANTEGGVFPAIFGTVVMTLLMSVAVVPFGVLAALYLREYAKAGKLVSTTRIAINNLAGVPSIVFGVFGLGFFCYLMGGTIDQLFFEARLPSPTFGTGGILWASLTLALLTLPVVIVATEEALAAVPSSMREGSYACGASKWQTIRRIVLPRALPGILTGTILAMARGAGEVAPLMLVGAVKLAPELPVDGFFPYVHLERSFMHLGFHIFDLGFQSQNSEAAKPMVYTTTLLLIAIVAALNLSAIWLRTRLRRKFLVSQV
jgi:phosphate transport system permease protein